jgi:FAD/FMN-containing dehydrogenase
MIDMSPFNKAVMNDDDTVTFGGGTINEDLVAVVHAAGRETCALALS